MPHRNIPAWDWCWFVQPVHQMHFRDVLCRSGLWQSRHLHELPGGDLFIGYRDRDVWKMPIMSVGNVLQRVWRDGESDLSKLLLRHVLHGFRDRNVWQMHALSSGCVLLHVGRGNKPILPKLPRRDVLHESGGSSFGVLCWMYRWHVFKRDRGLTIL